MQQGEGLGSRGWGQEVKKEMQRMEWDFGRGLALGLTRMGMVDVPPQFITRVRSSLPRRAPPTPSPVSQSAITHPSDHGIHREAWHPGRPQLRPEPG